MESSPNGFCKNNSTKQLCEDFFKLNIGCKFFDNIEYVEKLKTQHNYNIIFSKKQYGSREVKYVSPDRSDPDLAKKTFITLYNSEGETINDAKLVLVYFHGRGRAQTIRKVISKLSIPFIDIELPSETLWATIYMQPDERDDFNTCFPNQSVPMLYIKNKTNWVKLNCYNSSERILTILSCFPKDNLPTECPEFNEHQSLIFNLFIVSDKLKDVVYELGYGWTTSDGHDIRVKLPDSTATANLVRWKTSSKSILDIPVNIRELISKIIEGTPPYGFIVQDSRNRGLEPNPNNLQSWIDAWIVLTSYINELYTSQRINLTEYTNLLLAFQDSLVFLKSQKGIADDDINQYIPINFKELNEIKLTNLKFGGRKSRKSIKSRKYRKYRKYRKSKKYRKYN
jgi:hypothetical protein